MWLIDSCIYIDWLRKRTHPDRMLKPWLLSGEILTCGIIRLEVLRGVSDGVLLERMTTLFDVLPEVPLTSRLLHEATALAWDLDRKGRVLPSTDVLIAQCAIQQGATLVSSDEHFRHLPGLTWSRTLPPR